MFIQIPGTSFIFSVAHLISMQRKDKVIQFLFTGAEHLAMPFDDSASARLAYDEIVKALNLNGGN